jgi:hypothetical protein
MTKAPDYANDVAAAEPRQDTDSSETSLTIVVTPHELAASLERAPTGRLAAAITRGSQIASRAGEAATKATVVAAKKAGEAIEKTASATLDVAATAAKETTESARTAGEAIRQSTEAAAKATMNAAVSATAQAAEISAQVGERASKAAVATLHFVGDLNGDGRFDAEDLQIAKAAISKVAVELGGEAVDLAKGTMQHPLVRDAAAGAVVAGTVAVGVSLVGLPAVAAGGAAVALYRVTAGSAEGPVSKTGGKIASGAAGLVKQALKSAAKPQRKRRSAKPKPKP